LCDYLRFSTRVSNELGAAHPSAARLAVHVVLVMALIEGTLVGTVMILIRNIWAYAYSNEIEVVEYVAKMLPILAISHFLDGFQCVLSGCFFSFFPISIISCLHETIIQKHQKG
jgi:MATE family multidrug resistance protein